jgi:hypothetical protein
MQLTEMKVGGIYKTTLKVQMRSEKEIVEATFLIRIIGKTSAGFVEFCFLNDNSVHYLEPSQIDSV